MPTDSQSAFPIGQIAPSQTEGLAIPLGQGTPDPDNPPWGLLGALLVLFGSLFLQLLFSVLFLIPFLLQQQMTPAPNQGNGVEVILTNRTAALFQVLAILPSHILAGALVWAVVTRFGKKPFLASLGLVSPSTVELVVSVGLGIALFLVASGVAYFIGADKPTQLEQIINSSLAARYSLAALAVFTAPFVEELIYRGVLYSALQRVVGVSGAVVIVLGVFTLIHVPQYWPNYGVIAAVGVLSISLTIIRAWTERLLPCIVIHFVFNGIQSILLLVQRPQPTSDPSAAIAFLLGHLGRFIIWQ